MKVVDLSIVMLLHRWFSTLPEGTVSYWQDECCWNIPKSSRKWSSWNANAGIPSALLSSAKEQDRRFGESDDQPSILKGFPSTDRHHKASYVQKFESVILHLSGCCGLCFDHCKCRRRRKDRQCAAWLHCSISVDQSSRFFSFLKCLYDTVFVVTTLKITILHRDTTQKITFLIFHPGVMCVHARPQLSHFPKRSKKEKAAGRLHPAAKNDGKFSSGSLLIDDYI